MIAASVGFPIEKSLWKTVNYNFRLNEAENLKEVVIFTGKTSKEQSGS
jgi:hypothetical protein